MSTSSNWFVVKVRYTKQNEDGTFKRVTESYLVASMTFGQAEERIYGELGSLIRGEFIVTGITRADYHDIFHYEDSDQYFKCTIRFESAAEEGEKSKKVKQQYLITAHNVKEAYNRLQESMAGMMIDYGIPTISESPIVDVFPFKNE